jgi:lactobin A/cerein 7B family class IIb bacteriocin
MKIADYNLKELNRDELVKTNGGFLPLAAIFIIDGVMLACSAIALGMKKALDESK